MVKTDKPLFVAKVNATAVANGSKPAKNRLLNLESEPQVRRSAYIKKLDFEFFHVKSSAF